MIARDEVAEHLLGMSGLTICQGLAMDLQHHVFEFSAIQSHPAKHTIFCERDSSNFVYEVLDGVVMLSKLTADGRRQVTGFIYPGQQFGLAPGEDYGHDADCVTPVRLCRYDRESLERSFAVAPELARRILEWTAAQLAWAQEQMVLLGRKSALEKIASFLLHMSEQNDQRDESANLLFVPMTRGDIADYLGVTTETVSRTMTRLKNMGVLQIPDNDHVVVRDLDRLANLAEDEDRARGP